MAVADDPAFSDFGQQFLFLLLNGIGYLSQVGLVAIDGSLHALQFLLKFCTLGFQLGQLQIDPKEGAFQIVDQLCQLFGLLSIGVLGQ